MAWFWLRRLVRRHTAPIPEPRARKWSTRLNLLYLFFSWNAFGLVVYYVCTGRADWAAYHGLKSEEERLKPKGLQWAEFLGIENAKVYHIKGFRKTGEYEIEDGKIKTKTKADEENNEVLEA